MHILPFQLTDIQHSPHDTNLISILKCHSETLPWIMANFIQLQLNCVTKVENFWPKCIHLSCPFIDTSTITYQDCKNNYGSFYEFCKEKINAEQYINPILDISRISLYNATNPTDHNPIILGYDDETVHIADFFQGKYSIRKCSVKEINSSFLMLPLVKDFLTADYLGVDSIITLFRYKTCLSLNDVINKNFPQYLKQEIQNFLKSEPLLIPNIYEEENLCYGMDVLKKIIKHEIFNSRSIMLLQCWSLMWRDRINYIIATQRWDAGRYFQYLADNLIELSKKNVSLFLKMRYSKNYLKKAEIKERLKFNLLEFTQVAEHFLADLLSYL